MAQNIRTLQPGEYLCLQGEESREIYVLRTGTLEIYVVDSEGVVPQLRVENEGMLVGEVSEQGAFIGEIGTILNEPRSASMRASSAGPVQVMVIPIQGAGFSQTVVNNPKIGFSLSKTIAKRIGAACNSITKSDSITLKVKASVEHYAREIYGIVASMEAVAQKQQKEISVIQDAKNTVAYQIGRMIDKYGAIPMDCFTSMGLVFSMQGEAYKNRLLAHGHSQPEGQEAPEPAAEPRPGVAAFEAGAVVCPEKSMDNQLYILLAGKLEMFVGMRSLETINFKGDIFGENAMFGEMERSTGIRALTAVHAMPIPKDKIEPFLLAKPPVMVHVLRSFARRLPLLNETLLKTAHQMTYVMNILGRGTESCLSMLSTFVPRLCTETLGLGAEAPPLAKKAEALLEELNMEFTSTNARYDEICSEIGYKPKEGETKSSITKIAPPKFDFATKIEQLEMLDIEHANFLLNPKKDQFRACAIEYDHEALIKQAKIPDATRNDFIWGRIHNIGESFPSQYITLDLNSGTRAGFDRNYAMSALKYFVGVQEQEVSFLFRDGRCIEAVYIPDHIKAEADEVVDEATIMGIIDAFRKKPDDRDNLEKLNALFWDLLIATVTKKLPKVKDNLIPFEDKELNLINFGLLDEQFLPEDTHVIHQIAQDKEFKPNELQGLKYIYLTDSLQDMYKEAFGHNAHQKIVNECKKAESELKACQERIVLLTRGRTDMVTTFPGGNSAVPFVQKLDGLAKAMAILDRKMKAGRSISNEERAKIVQAKNAKVALTNQISRYLTTIKGKVSDDQIKQFTDLGVELEVKLQEDLVLQEKVARRVAEVKQHEMDMKSVTMKARETAYKNEIIRLKKYILLTAKKCKVDPMAVLVNVRDIATKARVSDIIDLFMSRDVDPEVFDPRLQRIKQLGNPQVMLVPGSGAGLYDWEKHVFLIPLNPPKTLEESIANAFVEFHWDMDEDKSMRESYGALKVYKKLPLSKLKQQLAKDYVTWATQESKGWRKLEKEVREWFTVKIARQKLEKK